jgi:short-subunit dehydrogenase
MPKPKPLNKQVVVITGASSGIGRESAIQFGQAGASVVLVARNEEALHDVAREVEAAGGYAMMIPTDVTDFGQLEWLAEHTALTFGHIDTWVNNAGISVYATAENTSVEEARQVMQVNFMGVVHGVSAILPYMKRQGFGTIINVGSVESRVALPLQAVYAASKHAVRGYTDALRMEEMYAKSGINVTLIMPSGINTPLFRHARSKIGVMPMPVAPAYSPKLVARAIVNAAQFPQREILVGGAGFFLDLLQRISPALVDSLMTMRGSMFRLQSSDRPDDGEDNLFEPMTGNGRVEGDYEQITKTSLYTPVFEFIPRPLRVAFMLLALPITILAAASAMYKQRVANRQRRRLALPTRRRGFAFFK